MEILTKAVSLILSLSILVILHELGHFIPAKLFKTKVEKFYLFFDPWFSLVKKKVGDTVYGIGWLPLGGYVKIAGMVDESMDKEQMKKPPEPWEFRSKPAWQRLIIMVGGVTVNILLAFVIYSMLLFTWGDKVLTTEATQKNGVDVSAVMEKYGFKDGDVLLAVDGETPHLFSEFQTKILLDGAKTVQINRSGKDTTINIPEALIGEIIESKKGMFSPMVDFKVEKLADGSLNKDADLQKGDLIVGIDSISTPSFQFFTKEITNHSCKAIKLQIVRDGSTIFIPVKVNENGKIGVYNQPLDSILSFENKSFDFFESIPAGFNKMTGTLSGYIKQFKLIFTPEGASGLGGFGALGGLFPESFSAPNYWQQFWEITALLSVILAFMNILPIPALDGGHVMFLLYEIIFRRKPGEKFMEYAQMGGMILLLSLMVFANGNDLFKAMFGGSDEPDPEKPQPCWQAPAK